MMNEGAKTGGSGRVRDGVHPPIVEVPVMEVSTRTRDIEPRQQRGVEYS